MKCKYWNDPAKCQYCNATEDDQLQWRSSHKVVSYFTYRLAVILMALAAAYAGGVVGYKVGLVSDHGPDREMQKEKLRLEIEQLKQKQ